MRRYLPIALSLALIVALLAAAPASAHRPYFEEEDIVAAKPWQIDDPDHQHGGLCHAPVLRATWTTSPSTGGRATASCWRSPFRRSRARRTSPPRWRCWDRAWAARRCRRGSRDQPAHPQRCSLRRRPARPTTFFEPFSRTSYWERQSQRVTLPADGRYLVAIWHPTGETGRYGFVIGDKERPGGDLAFMRKLRSYWTPVQPAGKVPDAAPASIPQDERGNFWRLFGIR